jgi:hypothetical protein
MRGFLLGLVLLGASVSRADTLFLANNSVLNGQVTYEDGRFDVTARFVGEAGASRRLSLTRDAVSRLEFNRNDLNPGRSEGLLRLLETFGLRAPEEEAAPHRTPPSVRVVTRAGGIEQARLVRISEREVELSCEEGRKTFRRDQVRLLVLGE